MAKIKNKEQYDWVVSRVEFLLPLVKEDAKLEELTSIKGITKELAEKLKKEL